ncbi:TIR domain-containing protein [uncultured Pseudoteredinibacter sp.]|uniref:TIR domain-containing protein n=1 Tax=uncultured Pseudoteredinibacter sp. TaxID=1641701 RepID=UPI002606C65B|nr:TIR domain-containing protein [uncultured Pseudoteredinibacter sp.]
MRRCRGRNRSGDRCKKRAADKSNYCGTHFDQAEHEHKGIPGAISAGLTGLAIGGPVVGAVSALAGALIGSEVKEEKMAKTKVFVSFDYDNDSDLKTLLAGQAKNSDSPFEIEDWSVKEHMTGDWKAKVKSKMKRVDQVAVICGEKTHTATGVSAEINIAKEVGVPYYLLKGRASKTCTRPKAATSNDKLYNWTWDNLKILIGGGR